jgi:hypothetical protein
MSVTGPDRCEFFSREPVDIYDSAPTTDQWNYTGVEILPGT